MRGMSQTFSPETIAYAALTGIIEPADTRGSSIARVLGPIRAVEAFTEGITSLTAEEHERLSHLEVGRGTWGLWARRAGQADPQAWLETVTEMGGGLLTPEDWDWSIGLQQLGQSAPVALWHLGNTSLMRHRSLGVVGSRASSAYGNQVSDRFCRYAAEHGVVIVSGGAYGIDACAHRAALGVNGGATVAVMAGGLSKLYPAGNEALLRQVAQVGLLLSEVPPTEAPTRLRFLARNRLIAALSQALLVVESGMRSGSMNTVRHAETLGRRIGAVPGPVTSETSHGTNDLIARGRARAINSADAALMLAGGPAQEH